LEALWRGGKFGVCRREVGKLCGEGGVDCEGRMDEILGKVLWMVQYLNVATAVERISFETLWNFPLAGKSLLKFENSSEAKLCSHFQG
jgi:hypothetical protein